MNLFFSSNGFRHETDHIYRKKITVNLSCWHFHGICPERVGLYKHICFCSTHDLKSWSMCWKFLQCILETPEAYVEVLAAYVGKSCSLCWIILQRILEHLAAYDVKSCSLFWKVLQHMMENLSAYDGKFCSLCWKLLHYMLNVISRNPLFISNSYLWLNERTSASYYTMQAVESWNTLFPVESAAVCRWKIRIPVSIELITVAFGRGGGSQVGDVVSQGIH